MAKTGADRHLQAQIKNTRVMTIQKSESGTDFGIVGFKERKKYASSYLPKIVKTVCREAHHWNRPALGKPESSASLRLRTATRAWTLA